MSGKVIELFSWEVVKSYRSTLERIKKHPIMTAWFLILLIGGFWMVLNLIEFATNLEDPFISPSRGDVLFGLFFFIMAKASAETVENTFQNKNLKHLFSTSIKTRNIQFSRLLKVEWYNLLLVALSMAVASAIIIPFGIDLPIDNYFFPHLYVLMIIAPMIGFNLASLTYIRKLPLKLLAIFIYGQNITLIWQSLHGNYDPVYLLFFFISIGVLSFLVALSSKAQFFDSWKYGTVSSTNNLLRFHEVGDFVPNIFPINIRRIAEKEILIRWRRREIPASIGVTILIGIGLLFFYFSYGPTPNFDLGIGDFFYPMLISISLYLAAALQVVIPSLSLFGREGRRLWTLKSSPVPTKDVVWGKVISMLFFTPIILMVIALPIPILLGYELTYILFILFASVAMIFIFTGIGIWASSRFPNFNESVEGSPDIITMYTVLVVDLIAALIFIAFPASLFMFDNFLGLLGMIFFADMSALILVFFVSRSSKLYDKIEVTM
ncbi:MAG: putative ABC transporter permease subunit [Thermoplasmatota archaeon]